MGTIVEFPRNKIVRESPIEPERIKEMQAKGLKHHAANISEDVIHVLLHDLDSLGIDTTTQEFFRDFFFLSEVITATIHRSVGVPHRLHEFIDTNVKIESIDGQQVDEEPETVQ